MWNRKGIVLALCIGVGLAGTGFLFQLGEVRKEVRQITCVHNLKLMASQLQKYARHHSGHFPDRLSQLYPEYFYDSLETLVCPVVAIQYEKEHGWEHPLLGDPSPEEIDSLASYRIVPGLSKDDSVDTILVHEIGNNHWIEGHGVLYLDGRAFWLDGSVNEDE